MPSIRLNICSFSFLQPGDSFTRGRTYCYGSDRVLHPLNCSSRVIPNVRISSMYILRTSRGNEAVQTTGNFNGWRSLGVFCRCFGSQAGCARVNAFSDVHSSSMNLADDCHLLIPRRGKKT